MEREHAKALWWRFRHRKWKDPVSVSIGWGSWYDNRVKFIDNLVGRGKTFYLNSALKQ